MQKLLAKKGITFATNLYYYLNLMKEMREAIQEQRFEAFKSKFYEKRKK